MSVTEVSAPEALRCAMQLVVDVRFARATLAQRSRLAASPGELQNLVLDALACVSRWTCVQWGCEVGWWSQSASERGQQRNIGWRRLSGFARGSELVGADDQVASGGLSTTEADVPPWAEEGMTAAEVEQVWSWVSVVCERARQEGVTGENTVVGADGRGSDAFAAVVSAFENALQIVAEVGADRVMLKFGRANTAHARRKSGSYYTPTRIVNAVLDQTLARVLEQRRLVAGEFDEPLRVLDPACGAGLFLVEAARRITERRLASLNEASAHDGAARPSGDDRLSDASLFARTVAENICGVDLNPLAVAWCRLWLWSCAADPTRDIATFAPGLRVGNAIVGAPVDYWRGCPSAAWRPAEGDDKAAARRHKKAHERAVAQNLLSTEPDAEGEQRWLADAWCAAFVWPKREQMETNGETSTPTYDAVVAALASPAAVLRASVHELAARYRFFHWPLEFREVTRDGGFDVIVGNPPWIAHAGRASQALEPRIKQYFTVNYRSFNGYPTTHGLFVERAVALLKVGGSLGFVLPASVSELGGYEATRAVHDAVCDFDADLPDFGEGCFPGVTQPSMALISRRRDGGRTAAAAGAPWPMEREDLGELGRALLARLGALPVFDPGLFGERGIQTDQRMKAHLSLGEASHGRFTTPVREGADIREFWLEAPKLWADWPALGRAARAPAEYQLVRFVVRQTASFPIATLYDGLPFRNSLLAGFGSPTWTPEVLVALLNSSLIRWHHYMRHRDARQPVLPQVKVGHLRAVPRPVITTDQHRQRLARLATAAQSQGEMNAEQRLELDATVAEMYAITEAEAQLVWQWAEPWLPKARRKASAGG